MNIKTVPAAALILCFVLCLIPFNCSTAAAQSAPDGGGADERRLEVGVQFTAVRVDNDPIAIAFSGRRTEPGFGGRLAYNLNGNVALESEVNFFPRDYGGFRTPLSGGRITQGLFGVKAGGRGERFGLFGKARPGFVRYHRAVENVRFPGGNGPDPRDPFGFEYGGATHLALDVGGVVEYYPSRRTVVRLDLGDTLVRYAGIPVFDTNRGFIDVTEYQHNFQVGVGFGFRF